MGLNNSYFEGERKPKAERLKEGNFGKERKV
jgi:hypothetical protein